MSAIGQLAMSVGKAAASTAGAAAGGNLMNQIGYGLGNLTGYNKSVAEDQLEQERALSGIQLAANKEQMKYNHDLQYEMWNKTSPAEQLKRIKEAGLNPALMYSNGGGGGGASMGSGGGGSAGRSSASDEVSRKMANIQAQGMALQNAKFKAELDNINADTELKKANADKSGSETETLNRQRDLVLENLRQEGIEKWLNNEITNYKMDPGLYYDNPIMSNPILNWYTNVSDESAQVKELNANILKTLADTGNAEANMLLTNKKAEGYIKELVNATIMADSAKINALSNKLEAEFVTGTEINWKNLGEVFMKLLGALRR